MSDLVKKFAGRADTSVREFRDAELTELGLLTDDEIHRMIELRQAGLMPIVVAQQGQFFFRERFAADREFISCRALREMIESRYQKWQAERAA